MIHGDDDVDDLITIDNHMDESLQCPEDEIKENKPKKIIIKGRKVKRFTKNLHELDESDEEFFNSFDKRQSIVPKSIHSDNSSEKSDDSKTYGLRFHNKLLNTGKILSHWNDNSQKIIVDMNLLERTNKIIQKIATVRIDKSTSSDINEDFKTKPLERWSSGVESEKENDNSTKTNPIIEEKLAKIQQVETKTKDFEISELNNVEKSQEILDKTLAINDTAQVLKNFSNLTNSWLSGLSSATKIVGEATKNVASTTMNHAAKRLVDAQNIILTNAVPVVQANLTENLTNVDDSAFKYEQQQQQPPFSSNIQQTDTSNIDDWTNNNDEWDDEPIILPKKSQKVEKELNIEQNYEQNQQRIKLYEIKNDDIDDNDGWNDWDDDENVDDVKDDDVIHEKQPLNIIKSTENNNITKDIELFNENQLQKKSNNQQMVLESWNNNEWDVDNNEINDDDDNVADKLTVQRIKRDLESELNTENLSSDDNNVDNENELLENHDTIDNNVLFDSNINCEHQKNLIESKENEDKLLNNVEITDKFNNDPISIQDEQLNDEIVDGWDDWEDKAIEKSIPDEQPKLIGWSIDLDSNNDTKEIDEAIDFNKNDNQQLSSLPIGIEPFLDNEENINFGCNTSNEMVSDSNIFEEKTIETVIENIDEQNKVVLPSAPTFNEICDDKIESESNQINENENIDNINDGWNDTDVTTQREQLNDSIQTEKIIDNFVETSKLDLNFEQESLQKSKIVKKCDPEFDDEQCGWDDWENNSNEISINDNELILKTDSAVLILPEQPESSTHNVVKKSEPQFDDEQTDWNDWDDQSEKSNLETSIKNEESIPEIQSAVLILPEQTESSTHNVVKKSEPQFDDEQTDWNDWDDQSEQSELKTTINECKESNSKAESAVLILPEPEKSCSHNIVKKFNPKFDDNVSDWNKKPEKSTESKGKNLIVAKKNNNIVKKFNVIDSEQSWDDWTEEESIIQKKPLKTESKINNLSSKNKPKFNLVDNFDSDSKKQSKTKPKFSKIVDNWDDGNDDWSMKPIKPNKTDEKNRINKSQSKNDNYSQNSLATAMISSSSISSKQYQQLVDQVQSNSNSKTFRQQSPSSGNDDIRSALKTAAVTTVSHAVKNWSFNPVSIFDSVVDNLSNVMGVPSAEEMATAMRAKQNKK